MFFRYFDFWQCVEFDMKVIVQDRSGDYACTAYVTFKDAHSQENCLFAQ